MKGFFNAPRNEKASPGIKVSPGNNVSHIHQIETLNTRLENARKILAADRVFPGLNKPGHYVVFAPQENGFFIVNAEGCCPDEQRHIDLLEGYCEHRLAVDLFKEAQEEKGKADENAGKVEAPTVGGGTPSLPELVVNGSDGKTEAAHTNGRST